MPNINIFDWFQPSRVVQRSAEFAEPRPRTVGDPVQRPYANFRIALCDEVDVRTGADIPVFRTVVLVSVAGAEADVKTEVAADLEAGFCARDVEITGAVGVANANVLNRFRLSGDRGSGTIAPTRSACRTASQVRSK